MDLKQQIENTPEIKKQIGRQIKGARIMRAMKVEGLAKTMGVTEACIHSWENGTTNPTAAKLVILMHVLEFKLLEFNIKEI